MPAPTFTVSLDFRVDECPHDKPSKPLPKNIRKSNRWSVKGSALVLFGCKGTARAQIIGDENGLAKKMPDMFVSVLPQIRVFRRGNRFGNNDFAADQRELDPKKSA